MVVIIKVSSNKTSNNIMPTRDYTRSTSSGPAGLDPLPFGSASGKLLGTVSAERNGADADYIESIINKYSRFQETPILPADEA